MKFFFTFFFFCICLCTACSQREAAEAYSPVVTRHSFPIGQSVVALRQTRFAGDAPFFLLQLHSNETTAEKAAYAVALQKGIPFLQIHNQEKRLISFRRGGNDFLFDPNRIFSVKGIRKTLQQSGAYSDEAFHEVRAFSTFLLSLLDKDKAIVAVHNNTEGRLTIRHYQSSPTENIFIDKEQDEDDFFITNDEEIFLRLQEKNFNVVLEDASQVDDDGSLSLYCSREKIRYINVEAQHGHYEEQVRMLEALAEILQ